MFRHVFTINGQYTAISNDFILLYYKYKVYLLACLADFRFHLWSPAECAGYPFYTNLFTQAFYPLNFLLILRYKISGSYNPLDYQTFTVLGIPIVTLGLFMWLKLINTNLRAAVFATISFNVVAPAICTPYVIGTKRLTVETIDRAGKNFKYPTAHVLNLEDTLGSLVYSPAASTEG